MLRAIFYIKSKSLKYLVLQCLSLRFVLYFKSNFRKVEIAWPGMSCSRFRQTEDSSLSRNAIEQSGQCLNYELEGVESGETSKPGVLGSNLPPCHLMDLRFFSTTRIQLLPSFVYCIWPSEQTEKKYPRGNEVRACQKARRDLISSITFMGETCAFKISRILLTRTGMSTV